MPTNVNVCIHGFVLSTLLFDCGNNTGDQEGFLYGSITRNVRREISDQSMSNVQEDVLISICSSVPCGSFLSFYNNVGEINREDLEYHLGERFENIVGWYRFRRYSAMYPSAREQMVHSNLRAIFAPHSNMDDQYFVFGILSASNLPNFATHSFDYAFFTQRMDNTFRNLNLTILNLGDTRNSYRAGSMALPFMNSSSFNSVLSSSWNFNSVYEIEEQIQQFHNRLRSKLECLQEELAASDAINATLEDDIRRLSNEMQSLLATQERLSIAAAAREREAAGSSEMDAAGSSEIEAAGSSEREGAGTSERDTAETQESSDSDDDDFNDIESSDSKGKECTDSVESEVGKSGPSGLQAKLKESPYLKRAAEPVDRSVKRVCLDKYFESEDYQKEKAVTKPVTDSADEISPESSSPKEEDTASNSQLLVVDPDSGEMSAAQRDVGVQSDVSLGVLHESMIPSPASNVVIGMSDAEIIFEGGSIASPEELPIVRNVDSEEVSEDLAAKELSAEENLVLPNIRESSESSVREASTSTYESTISSRDASVPISKEVSTASKRNEVVSFRKDHGKKSAFVSSNAPTSGTEARRIGQSSNKSHPPFIIYASKKSEDKPESSQKLEEPPPEPPEEKAAGIENSQSSSHDETDNDKNDASQSFEKTSVN